MTSGDLELDGPITVSQLANLPAVIDLPTAARILGVGRTIAYEQVRAGTWPTRVLRVGRLIRVPTAALLTLIQ